MSLKKILMAAVMINLIISAGFAQSHGEPTSAREIFRQSEFLPEKEDGYRISVDGYFSKSTKFYLTNGELVSPSSYNDYKRYGMTVDFEKRIKDSVIGVCIPFTRTSSFRSKSYYPVGDYTLESIGDIGVRAGWLPYSSDIFNIYGEFKVEFPARTERSAFTDPYMYIGNDGHYALGGKLAMSYNISQVFNALLDFSYIDRLPRTRTIIEGSRALAITGNNLQEIKANLDIRDYIIVLLSGAYTTGKTKLALGCEWFYETKDRVSNIKSGGNDNVDNAVRISVGNEDAYLYSIIGSVAYSITNSSKLGIMFKTPFKGTYAYNEKIWTIMWNNNF